MAKDIFDNINVVSNELKEVKILKDKIKKEQQKEIENKINEIKKSYNDLLDNNKEVVKENKLLKLNKKLREYSTFDKDMLGNVIKELITTIEGKEYVYINAIHNTYERECTVFGSEIFQTKKYVDLIVDKEYAYDNYYDFDENDNKVNKIINNNRGILLESSDFKNKFITIYNFNNDKIYSNLNYKSFDYVKEFIDIIINYRYEKNIKEISEKELLKLLYDFIIIKKDLIQFKHNKLIEEEMKKKQDELKKQEESKEIKLVKKYLPKQLLVDKINDENKKELELFLNNILVRVDSNEGVVKASYEKELLSTNLMYVGKFSLNGIIKNCEAGPWNDWYFEDAEINHEAILAIYDIGKYKGFPLQYTYFSEISDFYKSYLIKNINDKYFIILYSPDDFYYSYNQGFILSKCEANIEKVLNSLINVGKYIEEKSNIYEEKGRKYILVKK